MDEKENDKKRQEKRSAIVEEFQKIEEMKMGAIQEIENRNLRKNNRKVKSRR
jgi:hypothetical protein